jgi:hypothetical protein
MRHRLDGAAGFSGTAAAGSGLAVPSFGSARCASAEVSAAGTAGGWTSAPAGASAGSVPSTAASGAGTGGIGSAGS